MKKYKKFVKLDLDNIREIIELPIFRSMYRNEVCDGDVIQNTYTFEFETDIYRFMGRLGGWLAQDVCGHWTSMGDEEYQKSKDAEV